MQLPIARMLFLGLALLFITAGTTQTAVAQAGKLPAGTRVIHKGKNAKVEAYNGAGRYRLYYTDDKKYSCPKGHFNVPEAEIAAASSTPVNGQITDAAAQSQAPAAQNAAAQQRQPQQQATAAVAEASSDLSAPSGKFQVGAKVLHKSKRATVDSRSAAGLYRLHYPDDKKYSCPKGQYNVPGAEITAAPSADSTKLR